MLNFILGFLAGLGTGEMIMIVFLVMLLFGAKKIPELARGLGKGIREFKDAASNVREEIEKTETTPDRKQA